MRWYSLLFSLLILAAAIVARGSSSGNALISTSREYLTGLSTERVNEAYMLLSDSLASLVSPSFLRSLCNQPSTGSIRIGRADHRGYRLSLNLDQGGSRTLWLRRDSSGYWRISGDSSLDNILGRAMVLCNEYAQNTVSQAVRIGDSAEEFNCPVTGQTYILENGILLCPAGHLGQGIDTGGQACSMLRDSLAALVCTYQVAGYSYPGSFQQMFEESQGDFAQRGGFRCPDNGYSYYTITGEGIYCPFHEQITPVTAEDIINLNQPEVDSTYFETDTP